MEEREWEKRGKLGQGSTTKRQQQQRMSSEGDICALYDGVCVCVCRLCVRGEGIRETCWYCCVSVLLPLVEGILRIQPSLPRSNGCFSEQANSLKVLYCKLDSFNGELLRRFFCLRWLNARFFSLVTFLATGLSTVISDVSFGTLNSLKKVQNLFLRIFANFLFLLDSRFVFWRTMIVRVKSLIVITTILAHCSYTLALWI